MEWYGRKGSLMHKTTKINIDTKRVAHKSQLDVMDSSCGEAKKWRKWWNDDDEKQDSGFQTQNP